MLLVAVFAAIHIANGCPVNPKPYILCPCGEIA